MLAEQLIERMLEGESIDEVINDLDNNSLAEGDITERENIPLDILNTIKQKMLDMRTKAADLYTSSISRMKVKSPTAQANKAYKEYIKAHDER